MGWKEFKETCKIFVPMLGGGFLAFCAVMYLKPVIMWNAYTKAGSVAIILILIFILLYKGVEEE